MIPRPGKWESFISTVLAACLIVPATIATAQTSKEIDYETFCKLPDVAAKRSAFLAAPAENRANLVRTQLERWRDANRLRLTALQIAGLAELIATIQPETYTDGPQGEEQRVKARAVAEKQRGLFTETENQAMQPYAPCIAKSR